MADSKSLKKALIGSTALIGGSLLYPATALAVSCPNAITSTALAGIACDFDSGSSVTVENGGSVDGISMNNYAPALPSFIINNGTITDTTNSVGLLINSSTLSNGIINTGTINAALGTGISIANTSTISGGITNSGTIDAVNQAVFINDSTISGGITNSGLISSSGSDNFVISNGSIIAGGLTNSGTISSTGVFANFVLDNNSAMTGDLLNTGILEATGNGAGVLIRSASSIAGAIINSGLISSNGGVGLEMLNSSVINGGITNSGIISGGTDGIAVHNAATINGSIMNSGMVHGDDIGIRIFSATTISGSLTNSGTISGENIGIAISSTAVIAGGISNSGTIQGNVYAINIDAGSNVSNIDLLSGGRIIGAIAAPSTDLNITFGDDFHSEGAINVNAINVAGHFTANNALTVANGVNVGGVGILTLASTVTGDINLSTGGTLNIPVGTGIMSAATGTADLSQGSVTVDVQNAPLLHNGDNVFTAATLITPASAVTDNSYVWNFALNNANTGYKAVQLSGSDLGFNQADGSTYNVLQAFSAGNTTNPAMLQVLGNLNSASSKSAAERVLESVEPTLNGSDLVSAQTLNNQTLDITGEQLAMLRGSGEYQVASLGDMVPAAGGTNSGWRQKGVRAWGQFFGAHVTQDERGGISGYNANTWGGVLGMDTKKISDQAVVGVAFGYGRTNANSSNSNHTDTDIGSYQLTLYTDYNPAKDTFLTGMLSYGWQNVDTARYNVGGTPGVTARGSFNANQYGARTELGKNFAYGSAIVTPSFMANYLHYSPDGYTESGAGGANLTVDRKDMNLLEVGPRMTISRAYQQEGGVLTPSVHGGLRYDVIGDHLEATNTFAAGGPAFETRGIRPGRGTVDTGVALKYQTAESWEFTANYDFQYKSDYTSNAAFLHAIYKF